MVSAVKFAEHSDIPTYPCTWGRRLAAGTLYNKSLVELMHVSRTEMAFAVLAVLGNNMSFFLPLLSASAVFSCFHSLH
ncbi:hypothetical protein V6N11_082777 [Hibiscus sabdariffa]|uniref:Uncharacterized protein n=1 Tax=Hibiscus sabdariffa TaxID=183260 RepID=A0ABR2QJY2_9ROSI